jgi:L-rhamnose isomerase
MGVALGSTCVNNIWVPDGYKDTPVDRMSARARLEVALDAMLAPKQDKKKMLDALECKLFGIGVEACTVGSHEFYMGYAIRKKTLLCLDMGHFHPTENIADKLSAVALSLDEILLHVSRPMRWDSDHVILLNDEIQQMAQELVNADLLERTRIGLDFFDATISRTAAWVIGTRNMQKALLRALLMPINLLKSAEEELNFTKRLVVTEEFKDMPFGAVWEEFSNRENVPNGQTLIKELERYQTSVSGRSRE